MNGHPGYMTKHNTPEKITSILSLVDIFIFTLLGKNGIVSKGCLFISDT